jgi:hypothetical protein
MAATIFKVTSGSAKNDRNSCPRSLDAPGHPELQQARRRRLRRRGQVGRFHARRVFSSSQILAKVFDRLSHLAPMGTVIRSAPASETLDFPVENFVAFFRNHRLLQYDRPIWRTAKAQPALGGELTAAFRDQLRLGCAVASIERTLLVATLSAVGVRPQVSCLREQALRGVAPGCCRLLSTRSGRRPP